MNQPLFRIQIRTTDPYIRQTLRLGFEEHIKQHELPWQVTSYGQHDMCFASDEADVFVGRFFDQETEQRLLAKNKQILYCGPFEPQTLFPCLRFDDRSIGQVAARHVWETGWRHAFVLLKTNTPGFLRLRQETFAQEFTALGGVTHIVHRKVHAKPDEYLTWLHGTLSALPHPVVWFSDQDDDAAWILTALQTMGFRVPEDIGLMSCGDSSVAETSTPTLSSVRLPWQIITRRAIMAVQSFAGTGKWPTMPAIAPVGVAERQSTHMNSFSDSLITKAVQIIQRSMPLGISVTQLSHDIGVSCDTLERHFRRELKLTPHRKIQQMRLRHAQKLLADNPTMAVDEIARTCGWCDASHLAVDFRRAFGITPAKFRMGTVP